MAIPATNNIDITTFGATGQSGTVTANQIVYFANGWGVGTIVLEAYIGDTWTPIITALTANMTLPLFINFGSRENGAIIPVKFRWNCTAYTSGDIKAIIQKVG